MLPIIIGAGISALMPLVAEAFREKPDPAAAATIIKSKRDEMVDKAIGAGLQRAAAEKQVDAEIQSAIKEAERQGQFNFPGGEMLVAGILGGVAGPLIGKGIAKVGGMLGKGASAAAGATDDAAAAAAKAAPKGNPSAVGDVDDVIPGRMPAIGDPKPASMTAPGPTGMPTAGSSYTKADMAQEFAGMPTPKQVDMAARDAFMSPFPGRQAPRGPQTLEQEFGIAPPYRELDLTAEFGPFPQGIPDRAGRMFRLRQGAGD